MATESPGLRRRDLLACAALSAATVPAFASPRPVLAASWERADGNWRVGLLSRQGQVLQAAQQIDVPTRAHGLTWLGQGQLLAVARRPGDWLVRWQPATGRKQWAWADSDRVFTGHAVHDIRAGRIYTGETDLENGVGLIGVRDARNLDKLAEWPTHGRDPHQFLLSGDGTLVVANGGLETRPESGRRKLSPERMDSSLVRLDAQAGTLLGQWRVQDTRLSLRHMAWGASRSVPVLGIAMQAEHDVQAQRNEAPVLALFDGTAVRPVPASVGFAGYAGDIAWTGSEFVVSAPRSGALARFDASGEPVGRRNLGDACALATSLGALLAAGGQHALAGAQVLHFASGVGRMDNHWLTVA